MDTSANPVPDTPASRNGQDSSAHAARALGLPAALAGGCVVGGLAGATVGVLAMDLAGIAVSQPAVAASIGASIGGLCGALVGLVGWIAVRPHRQPGPVALPVDVLPGPAVAAGSPAGRLPVETSRPSAAPESRPAGADFRPLSPLQLAVPAASRSGSHGVLDGMRRDASSGARTTTPAGASNALSSASRPALAEPDGTMPASFERPTDIRDALTGAYTQRYFIAAADREWSRIRRHGEDAAMLMIDADHLRRINDTHGRACGDAVLVQMTRLVMGTLRQYDLMARFNAGVLVVYLPQTDPIGAIDVAERIRERIHNFRMNWPTGSVTVTVSVGVASIGADHAELDQVIGDAGAALRAAKMAGRNCVRAAPVPPKRSPAATMGDKPTPG